MLSVARDSMKVRPSEIPWLCPPASTPTPCYSDENLQVYAIPVLPFSKSDIAFAADNVTETPLVDPSSPAEAADTPEGSGKRKREASPDTAHKRLNTGEQQRRKVQIPPALYREMGKPDFRPERLKGSVADDYRRLIVQHMFPATNLNVPGEIKASKSQQGKKAKGKVPNQGPSGESTAYLKRPRSTCMHCRKYTK